MKKVLLVILDGWGLSPLKEGNATYLAKTPNMDFIYGKYPKTSLSASGISVGVTPGESGNSEVGHLNIGSGRVVWESLPRIDQAIEKGELTKNENLNKTIKHVQQSGGSLHLIGLASAGSVHSNINHLFELLKIAASRNIDRVFIHMITDGRDTAPRVAEHDIKLIEEKTKELGLGKIVSVIGRFYAMDRDKHFERTAAAYNLWVLGKGDHYNNASEAVRAYYRAGSDDEKIGACALAPGGNIMPGDGIIFFNFRADRMRQILDAFENEGFYEFQRQKVENVAMASMTQYSHQQKTPAIFPPINMGNVLADLLESAGVQQWHIAETEKYAHVTYFFNGGEEKPHQNEFQRVVSSKKVEDYSKLPEMSAAEITDTAIEAISNSAEFIVVNYANGDMLGHSGDLAGSIKAVEAVDTCLGKLMVKASSVGYSVIITADHGNCELMINPSNGEINKEHTSSPVPFIIADLANLPFTPQLGTEFNHETLLEYSRNTPTAILADVAPTILSLMQIPKPPEMSGIDLTKLI